MERELEEKFDAIMGKPGVIGVVCADQRGLCVSDTVWFKNGETSHWEFSSLIPHELIHLVPSSKFHGRRSASPEFLDSSDSSDEDDMIGNNPRKRPVRIQTCAAAEGDLLSGSIRSASFNIVFQVFIRVFTFGLNAFILRYTSHDVLGICNVRLFLLYSSIMFLSREPFRRASQRVSYDSKDSWTAAINLIWFAVPNTALWALILGPVWCYVLSQPEGPQLASQYQLSVLLICLSTLLDSMTEAPYIVAKYFLCYKLRIVGETLLIVVRSSFLCVAVIFFPEYAVLGYSVGALCGAGAVCLAYYGYFHFTFRKGQSGMPFTSIHELLPSGKWEVSPEMRSFTWSFYKQSVLKQLLTEGERYLMTFFDILTFQEQGVYDLVSNLGSLAARFVFQPIEENSYQYFAQTLQRRCAFKRREKEMAERAAHVLSNVVRLMFLIGLTILVFGIPYSRTLLFLYGGSGLSDVGPGTSLLQANCAYIFIMAINGVTEAFTQAAMTQEEMDGFNRKLLLFSGMFVLSSFISTRLFGSLGFFIANSLNMSLRVGQSVHMIRKVFADVEVNPFVEWFPNLPILGSFLFSFLWILGAMVLVEGRIIPVLIGLVILSMDLFVIFKYDQELITFFVRIYKTKAI